MKTKIKALTSFVHGRVHLRAGEEGEFTRGDADDLAKAGLAEVIGSEQPADEGVDDLLGGEKMGDAPENKMEVAPDNKAGGKVKTHPKK